MNALQTMEVHLQQPLMLLAFSHLRWKLGPFMTSSSLYLHL